MQSKQRCLNPKESGTMLTSEFKERKKKKKVAILKRSFAYS